jgi:hypothetical protein
MYMNSGIIKSMIVVVCILWLHFLMRDALVLSHKQNGGKLLLPDLPAKSHWFNPTTLLGSKAAD